MMSPQELDGNSENNVDGAIAELQLAFSSSTTKGTVFWAALLLPDGGVNRELNSKAVSKLREGFRNQQKDLVESTAKNLEYLRAECLRDNDVRAKIEQAKAEAIEQSAIGAAVARARQRASGSENADRGRR